MTAELNNATSHCYLQHQIIEGLEGFGLPSGPNPLWIKVFWILACIAWMHSSQSKGSTPQRTFGPSPFTLLSPSCPQPAAKKACGMLRVTELILT